MKKKIISTRNKEFFKALNKFKIYDTVRFSDRVSVRAIKSFLDKFSDYEKGFISLKRTNKGWILIRSKPLYFKIKYF